MRRSICGPPSPAGRREFALPDTLRFLIDRLDTPIGEMVIVADAAGRLRALDWDDYGERRAQHLQRAYGSGLALREARDPGGLTSALRAYFSGDLAIIDGLPTDAAGTPFQKQVWSALRTIPCGTTISYGELARRIGRPAAVRAVGLANGSNPIGVVVPCHRVIGANGTLTGYGGGLNRKSWLLAHESPLPLLAAGARGA